MAAVVLDLDNTLFFTDTANNYSYIEALKYYGYDPSRLQTINRITSKVIQKMYPEISRFKLWRIRRKKLKVFINNLYLINLNQDVMKIIDDKYSKQLIILWTASNQKRTLASDVAV